MSRIDEEDMKKGKEPKRCTEDEGREGQGSQAIDLEIHSHRERSLQGPIPLPSFTFHRHGSRLEGSSITMTIMSDFECNPAVEMPGHRGHVNPPVRDVKPMTTDPCMEWLTLTYVLKATPSICN